MEQDQKEEKLISKSPEGDCNNIVSSEEDINSNSVTTESIVTPQQCNSSSSNNNNNNIGTSNTILLPESSSKLPQKFKTEQKESHYETFSTLFTDTSDTPSSSLRKTTTTQTDQQQSDYDESPQTSSKVPTEPQQNRIPHLSVRVQGVLRRILGDNYSDMDPNFHSPVVNSPISTTSSSPSSSSSLPCSPQISQKRLSKSDSFCDCYVLGKEKSCQCGEEDSYFDWVWDEDSKSSACHLKQDHREVMFHMYFSCGTAAVRGTVPMRENQHYWEVKMTSTVYGTDMMVGVSTMNIDLDKYRHAFCSLLGRDEDSWGLSYTGVTHHKAQKELYTSKFGQGDIIGVHLDMWLGTMSYYKNRRPLGIAYRGLQGKSLYPVVSSTAARSGMKMVKCRSFPTSLQFACCQALRRYIPPHLDVLEVVDLPPGLRSFLKNKVSWLLQACAFSTQKNLMSSGKKRPCSEPSDGFDNDARRKRRCLWEVCPLEGMS